MRHGAFLLAAAAALIGCGTACSHMQVPSGAGSGRAHAAAAPAMSFDAERDIVLAVADPLVPPPTHAGSNLLGYAHAGHYGGAGARAAATLAALQRRYGWRALQGWPIKSLHLHCIVLKPAAGADRSALLKQLAEDDRVKLAEPLNNFFVYASPVRAAYRYNDPYVRLERGFSNTDAARAHAVSQGKGVDIAVVDTGADAAHPDLRGQIRGTEDVVGQGASAFASDSHGTEVAGIIAATGNNHIGIVGMAPKAKLSIYKACWYMPDTGTGARCNSFTLAKALAAVIDNKDARIVNMSLGGPADPLLARLMAKLLDDDRIVVAAMPPSGRLDGFPGNIPGVIVVRAAGASSAPTGVLSAPGHDILTTQPEGHYDFVSGSSMAAASVSGIAALLVSINPQLSVRAIRDLLVRTSKSTDGTLQVNAATAVEALTVARLSEREP